MIFFGLIALIVISSSAEASSLIDNINDDCKSFTYDYRMSKSATFDRFNFDIPLNSAIDSLESSEKRYHELSLRVNCVNWMPLGGIDMSVKSFQKLRDLGIRQIFVEIGHKPPIFFKKFDMKIKGNILSLPRHLFDKRYADDGRYIELAIDGKI